MDEHLGGMSLLINKGSVFDLAATYVMLFKDNTLNSQQKNKIIYDFCVVLSKGWTFKEVSNNMHQCIKSKTPIDDIVNFFTVKCHRNVGQYDMNILAPTQLYYHKQLKIISKPQCINVDYNAGTMVSNQPQEFFLEMAASYTVNELTDYFMSKDMIDTQEYSRSRISGLMKYYVDRYGIDAVLFMIEAACQDSDSQERKMVNMREFENYYTTAKEFVENIKNNMKYAGGDKIVPRKRVLY